MVAWVVLDRRHYRRAGTFALPLSTPPFPLPHLTPLLPYSYGHSYTTSAPQPLCNQSVTHSFYRHGGCSPPLTIYHPLPTLHLDRASRVTLLANPAGGAHQWHGSPALTQVSKDYSMASSRASSIRWSNAS